ncbi:MAG: tyrosine-type recombinase/integrase, partial [Gammaproteobacteria bacterium]
MKNRREHRVPLSQQALATLEELHKVSGHSRWLMPGRLDDKPASQNTMIFAVCRMGFHKRTVHGFRALASTILNEAVTEVDLLLRSPVSFHSRRDIGLERVNVPVLSRQQAPRQRGLGGLLSV